MGDGDKPDVLQLSLSRYHSLDVVRLPKTRKYRVVFAERFGVQRRAFVEISFDEALRLARFLANVEDGIIVGDGLDPPTDPSRPTNVAPPELRDLEADQFAREAPPLPPLPRTRSRNVTGDAIPKDLGSNASHDETDD